MEEKFVLKSPKSLMTILIICISIVSVGFLFNQHDTNKHDVFYSETIDIPQVSQKPDYIVYPTISNITITHEDNISLYASSGDGLSCETAYIIENVSITGDVSQSIIIYNISSFLKIRNFQVFLDQDGIMVKIDQSKNIRFENGSLISSANHYAESFFIRESSVQVFDIYIQDSAVTSIYYSNNSIFEQVIYNGLRFSKIFNMNWCNNISFINNYFSYNSYSYATLEGFRCHGIHNITFRGNKFNNNGLRILSDSSLIEIENNTFTQIQDIVFVGTQLIFKNNSVNFKGYRFNIYGTNITIENNHFTSSYDAYQGNEGVLYLQNCNNVFIRYNAFDSEQAILGLSECELINFEYNSIEINGEYVVFLQDPSNFGKINLILRWNCISGTFNRLFSDVGAFSVFFMLFTNKLPVDPLILINIVFTCLFFIVGTIYVSNVPKLRQTEQKSHTKGFTYQIFHPFTLGIACSIITTRIFDPSSFIMIFIRSYSNNPIRVYYAQLIAFIVVWIGASVFIGLKFGLGYKKWKSEIFHTYTKEKGIRNLFFKQFLLIILPNIVLFVLFMNLGYILSELTILLHFSVTFLIVCIGFRKDFKLIGLKLIQVSSITIFMLTDFIVTFLLAYYLTFIGNLGYLLSLIVFAMKFLYFALYIEFIHQNPFHSLDNAETRG